MSSARRYVNVSAQLVSMSPTKLCAFCILFIVNVFGSDESCQSFGGGHVYPQETRRTSGHTIQWSQAVSECRTKSKSIFYPSSVIVGAVFIVFGYHRQGSHLRLKSVCSIVYELMGRLVYVIKTLTYFLCSLTTY